MGSVIGKRMKATLAILLSVALVLGLNPASAMAAWNDNQSEPNQGEQTFVPEDGALTAPEGEVGENEDYPITDMSGQASTNVTISTYSNFRLDKYRGPSAAVTYKEAMAADPSQPNSLYVANYIGATPDSSGNYVATWSWTKKNAEGTDVTPADHTLTQTVAASEFSDSAKPTFTMTLKEGPLNGQSATDAVGTYAVSLTVNGVAAAYPDPFTFSEVEILSESNTQAELNDNSTTNTGSVITGGFVTGAELYMTDLMPSEDNTNPSYSFMANNEKLNGSTIGSIWQVDVVDDTFLPNESLVSKVNTVKMPLGSAGAAIAAEKTITIASLVDGQVRTVEYTRTSADGAAPAVFATTSGEQLEATVEQGPDGTWFITFPAAGLGNYVGVYAVATPIPEGDKVTVNATSENGTVSPSGSTTIKSNSNMEYTLAPAEGYVLNPAPTVELFKAGTNTAVSYTTEIVGNVLTIKNVDQDLDVKVTFSKAAAADVAAPVDLTVDINNVDGAAGVVTVVRTDNATSTEKTNEIANKQTLTGVKAGTSVFLTFGQKTGVNSVVEKVEVGPDDSHLTPITVGGTSYTFTMTAQTAYVKVTYKKGIPPVTAMQTISGTISPNGAGNFGMKKAEDGSDTTDPITNGEITKVAYGDYARITVNASENYTISEIKIVPITGEGDGEPQAVEVAAGATTQTVAIPSVTCDYRVDATFVHEGIILTTLPATTNGGSLAGVFVGETELSPESSSGDGSATYKLQYGASVTVKYNVEENFAMNGVYVDGALKPVTNNSYTFTADAAVSIRPSFVNNELPPNPEKYSYVTVTSNVEDVVTPYGPNQIIDAETGKLTLNFGVSSDAAYKNYKPSKVKVSYAGGAADDIDVSGKWAWEFDVNDDKWKNWDTGAYTIYVEYVDSGSAVEPPAENKKATITIATTAGGKVTPAGDQTTEGEYKYEVMGGTEQSFTFVPNDGYTLSKVKLDLDGNGLVDVTNDETYVKGSTIFFTPGEGDAASIFVEFKPTDTPSVTQYVVTTKVHGNGSISPDKSLVQAGNEQAFSILPADVSDPATMVNELTKLMLKTGTADPVNITSMVVNGSIKLTINDTTELEATFKERPLDTAGGETPPAPLEKLTILGITDAGGSVSPAGTQTVVKSASPSYTFNALTGYEFSGMEIWGSKTDAGDYGTTPIRTVNATAMDKVGDTYGFTVPVADYIDQKYKAIKLVGKYTKINQGGSTTAPKTFTVTATQSGIADTSKAHITPSGTMQLAEGASQTFYFVTTANYEVKTVRVDGVAVASGVSEYTISGIQANTTIDVEFGARGGSTPTYPTTHTVNVNAPVEGGAISPTGAVEVPEGEDLTLTFIPADGYMVDTVTVNRNDVAADYDPDVTKQLNGSTYTIKDVKGDADVDVTFKKIPETATDPGTTEVDIIGGDVSPKPPIITDGTEPGTTIVIQPEEPDDPDNTIKDGKITVTMDNGIKAEIELTPADKEMIIKDGWTLDTGDITKLAGATNATVLENPNGVKRVGDDHVYAKGDKIDLTAQVIDPKDPVNPKDQDVDSVDKVDIEIGKGTPGTDPTTGKPDPDGPSNQDPSYPTNSGNNKGDDGTTLNPATVKTRVTCNGVTGDGVSAGGTISPASSELAVGKKVDGSAYKYTYVVSSFEGYYLSVEPTIDNNDGGATFERTGAGLYTLTLPEGASGKTYNISLEFAQIPTHVVADEFKIHVSSSAGGKVQPAGNADGDVVVAAGGMQSFSFIPDEGYQLDYITVTQGARVNKLSNIGPSYTISGVYSDMQLAATFAKKPDVSTPEKPIKPTYDTFTINATATAGGKIIPNGDTTVNSGASLSFSVKPDTGYKFSYIMVDDTTFVPGSNLVNNQYTLTNIKANHDVSAVFVAVGDDGKPENPNDEKKFTNYKISVVADSDKAIGGYVTPSGSVSVMQGGTPASVQVQPYFGYEISSITIKRAGQGDEVIDVTHKAGQKVTLKYSDQGDGQLEVLFAKTVSGEDPDNPVDTTTRYVITSSVAGGNGYISPAGTQTVAKGTSQTFTVVPNDGYKLDNVTVNGNPLGDISGNSFQINEILGNMTIVAKFKALDPGEAQPAVPATADLIATSTGPGTISPSGTTTVERGKSITYTLTPDAGCRLATLTVNGIDRTNDVKANLTYDFVASNDAQIVAAFADAKGNTQVLPNEVTVDVIVKAEVRVTGEKLSGKVIAVGGKTSNGGASTTVKRGSSVDFVIMPDDGYYAASAYYEYDGKQMPLTIRPLAERGSGSGRAVVPAAALSAMPETSGEGVDVAGLLGIEKAYAAGEDVHGAEVQKTYSFVTVPDVQGSGILYIEFLPCEKDPANKDKQEYYSYRDQRDNILNLKPTVGGGATTAPSLSDIVVDLMPGSPSVEHDIEIKPANPDEPISEITIAGQTFPCEGYPVGWDDMTDEQKKDFCEDEDNFADEFNKWAQDKFPSNPPTLEPTKDSSGNNDGGYTLTVDDQIFKDDIDKIKDLIAQGKPIIGIGGGGTNGVAYIYDVGIEINEDGGTIVVMREDDTTRTYGNGETISMNFNGKVKVIAYPEPGYQLKVNTEGGVQENLAERSISMLAASPLAANGEEHIFNVTSAGKIKASFEPVTVDLSSYSVKTVVYGNGTVTPSGTKVYKVGDPAPEYTLMPATNYQIKSIKINGEAQQFSGTKFVFPEKYREGDKEYTLEVTFGPGTSGGSTNIIGSGVKTLQSLAQTGDLQMPLILVLCAIACAALGAAIISSSRRKRGTTADTNRAVHRR